MSIRVVKNPDKNNEVDISRTTKRIRIPEKSGIIFSRTKKITSDSKDESKIPQKEESTASKKIVKESNDEIKQVSYIKERTDSVAPEVTTETYEDPKQQLEVDIIIPNEKAIKSDEQKDVVIKPREILESYIDIRPFLKALKFAIPLALFIGICFGVLGYGYSKTKTKLFDSTVSFIINEPDEVEGVSTTENRSQHIMSIFERGFILDQKSDNYRDYIIAEMKSRSFTNYFISKLNLKSILFSKVWDKKKNTWKEDKKKLSQYQIYSYFSKDVRFIHYDEETGLMYLRIKWQDPVQSSKWANRFISEFNIYIRDKKIRSIEDTVGRIKDELEKTEVLEIKHALSRVLQGKTAISVFTHLKEDVVLSIIDPAIPNWTPVAPKGKIYFIFFFVACFVATFTLYMLFVFYKQVKIDLTK